MAKQDKLIKVECKFDRYVNERYVVGIDEFDCERWFDMTTTECSVVGTTVCAKVSEKRWKIRNTEKKAPPAKTTRERKCLCCGETKEIEIRMFVCGDCKQTDTWKSGSLDEVSCHV